MRLNNKGIALVFVLWVLVFLSIIVGSFAYSMRQGRNAVFYEGLQTKAYYIAQAGFYNALTGYIQAQKDDKESEWRINTPIHAKEFGDGYYQVFISNESGKINLNKAGARLLRILLNNSGLDDRDKDIIVDSILDWRDDNNFYRLNGAENDYYLSLPEPYRCRNGEFLTLPELLKVRGVTPEIYQNFFEGKLSVKKDENELLPLKSSLQEYLQLENRSMNNSIQTFLSLDKRKEMNRIGKLYDHSKININAASPGMLKVLPGMDDNLVEKIIEYRNEKDFKALNDFQKIIGKNIYNGLKEYVSLSLSRYYTITSRARVKGSDIIQSVKMDIWLDNSNYDGYKVLQRY